MGVADAVRRDRALAKGVNIWKGRITYRSVAEAFDEDCIPLGTLL
jgi:alanine dehydrogenase